LVLGQYQELGLTLNIQRASSDAMLLGIEPPLLKTGSQSRRIRIFGDHFPAQILQSDLDFGPGISGPSHCFPQCDGRRR